jgi:Mg/Co/Ni transporter MgtE
VPSLLSMAAARKIAQLKSADSLIVEDKGRLLGVLDRDSLRRAGDDQRVGECLKPLQAFLSPTTSLEHARALLIKYGAGSLPVAVGPFLVGSLSRTAVERALASEELPPPSRLAA